MEKMDKESIRGGKGHREGQEQRDGRQTRTKKAASKSVEEKDATGPKSAIDYSCKVKHDEALEGSKAVTTMRDIANKIKAGKIRRIVVMTGAGVSVNAGIPDFRSPGVGLYSLIDQQRVSATTGRSTESVNDGRAGLEEPKKPNESERRLKGLRLHLQKLPTPEAIFSIDFFRQHPEVFNSIASLLFPGRHCPTRSHFFSYLLQQRGLLLRHYTQNIDNLERLAGVKPEKLVEAHGSFLNVRCIDCGKTYDLGAYYRAIIDVESLTCRQIDSSNGLFNAPRCGDATESHGDGGKREVDSLKREDDEAGKIERCAVTEKSGFQGCSNGCGGLVKPDIVFFGLVDEVSRSCIRLLINKQIVGLAKGQSRRLQREWIKMAKERRQSKEYNEGEINFKNKTKLAGGCQRGANTEEDGDIKDETKSQCTSHENGAQSSREGVEKVWESDNKRAGDSLGDEHCDDSSILDPSLMGDASDYLDEDEDSESQQNHICGRKGSFVESTFSDEDDGFRFFRADNERDVLYLGDSDAGVKVLCRLLGWEEELERHYLKSKVEFDENQGSKGLLASEESAGHMVMSAIDLLNSQAKRTLISPIVHGTGDFHEHG